MLQSLAALGLLLSPAPHGATRAAARVLQPRLAEHPVAAVAPEPVGGPIEALIDAVAASKCGSINQLLVNAGDKEAVLGLVTEYKSLMNAVNIATSLHRLASLEKKNRAERDALLRDPRFEALLDAVVKRSEEFTPRQTADLLWSFATLRHWPPMLLKPLLLRVVHHLDRRSFAPHQLSIVTWAFATLECKPVNLLVAIEKQAELACSSFNPQNCANLLWGFAKLGQPTGTLLPAIAKRLKTKDLYLQCKPVEVADLAFACANMGTTPEGCSLDEARALLARLSTLATGQTSLNQFSSRQLVTLVWAHAKLDCRPPESTLAGWSHAVRAADSQRLMQAADRITLEHSLERMGEECYGVWLPPKESPKADEVEANQADVAA